MSCDESENIMYICRFLMYLGNLPKVWNFGLEAWKKQ